MGLALVIPQPGATVQLDRVLAALRGRLASYKIPKRCVVVDELLRNAMGKEQKNVLRQRWRDVAAAS